MALKLEKQVTKQELGRVQQTVASGGTSTSSGTQTDSRTENRGGSTNNDVVTEEPYHRYRKTTRQPSSEASAQASLEVETDRRTITQDLTTTRKSYAHKGIAFSFTIKFNNRVGGALEPDPGPSC